MREAVGNGVFRGEERRRATVVSGWRRTAVALVVVAAGLTLAFVVLPRVMRREVALVLLVPLLWGSIRVDFAGSRLAAKRRRAGRSDFGLPAASRLQSKRSDVGLPPSRLPRNRSGRLG
jgi:hypothetical protein